MEWQEADIKDHDERLMAVLYADSPTIRIRDRHTTPSRLHAFHLVTRHHGMVVRRLLAALLAGVDCYQVVGWMGFTNNTANINL